MVGLQLRILDRKTGDQKDDTGLMNVATSIRPGSPVIPVALKLLAKPLDPGSYRAELKAMDSTGRSSNARSVDFDVE